MSDNEVYDVPPPRHNIEIPPSLPPKRASTRSSFRDLDGSPKMSPDPRPKPKPRKTVRSSSSLSEKTFPTSPVEESSAPAATPRPVPRPRPRRQSPKSPDLSPGELSIEENLPPSADEIEAVLDEQIRKELAKEEREEKRKQQQEYSVQSNVSNRFDDHPDDFHQQGSEQDTFRTENFVRDKAVTGQSALSVNQAVRMGQDAIESLPLPTRPGASTGAQTRRDENSHLDRFDGAFGASDVNEGYAKIQKHNKESPDMPVFDTNFDPLHTSQASAPARPPLQSGMLQPTKVWDNPGYASGASVVPVAGTADMSGDATDQGESEQYETLWYSQQQQQDKPGIVRPKSDLMVFTPKPQAERDASQHHGPAYGERSGEYIELDPTYNVPPPPLPPPPLPAQVLVDTRPPSIPPRPPQRNPNPNKTLTMQNSSHLTESSTEEPVAVFEGLPTPGFNTPFHDDDPFKNSTFDSECQMFNSPLSADLSHGMSDVIANNSSSIYEIEDDFVPKWPPNFDDSNNTYNVIDADPAQTVSGDSDSSLRLSQVPPPPPRSRRDPGHAEMEAAVIHRETPSSRCNVYSLAHEDPDTMDKFFGRGRYRLDSDASQTTIQYDSDSESEHSESSHVLDSSDSSEDMFAVGSSNQQGGGGAAGPTLIAPPVQPQKAERYGYLKKQGGINANRGWKQRWVVFNGSDLRYYDNNRSQISKKIIPLSSMKEVIVDVKDGDTNRFRFRLVTTLRNRTFLFAADTRDDCCTWASVLMAAILKTDGAGGDAELTKPDKEGFVHFEKNNKKFYVAIYGKTLRYYDSFDDFQMHCPVHEIDMKLASVKDKKKNQLQLSTHYAYFGLVFDSDQETQAWRLAIEDAIAEGLADDSVLEKVYENDSNRICADCEDENPHWAAINLGIVLCKKCAGIHRMFSSKIRSLRMDTRVWTPSLIELMKAIGNANANQFWENDLLPSQKPSRDSLPYDRKTFAEFKYQKKTYCDQHALAKNKQVLNETLLQVASTSDLLEAMKIIFSGADLSFVGGPDRENAYEIAKRHGQRLLMELLYQNGGDCNSADGDSTSDEGRLREDVRLQGYLMKTGPSGRTFDQRWCVLEHGALTYYLNERSQTAKDSIDRKNILYLQEVPSERSESVFEISTTKGGNRIYTFGAESPEERGLWMRTLGKLICPVAVMDHVGMMDFSAASLVFLRESVSDDLKLDHVDLRKATQIKVCSQSGSCPNCLEVGCCFVLSTPCKDHSGPQTFYIQANLQRDTDHILENVSAQMKQSGPSLWDQQLTPDNVPVIVDKCLTQVHSRGQKEVGIYRKAATNSKVNNLIQELRTDAYAVRLEDYDIHEVANALKRFLRELEDSVFMQEKYNEWIRTSLIDDHNNKLLWYRYLLEKIPPVNYSTLRNIVQHIWKMAQNEEHTRMNLEAFCTCFAPTLMRTGNNHVHGNNPGNEIKVLLDLVSEKNYLFQIKENELAHEARILEEEKRILKVLENQQVTRKSQPSSSFLMPVSMYSHSSDQCEMVNTTPATTALDVVNSLIRKCNLCERVFCLSEMIFKGTLVRPLFPTTNVLITTSRWGDWEQSVREDTQLCLTNSDTLDKLAQYHDVSRPLFGEVKFADPKSRTKFKKATVEFKQCVLTFFKDARARNPLCSWKVEELTIYLGIDPKRSAPSRFGFTFIVNNREERSRNSFFGHCVSLASEEEMYRWVSALLVAQNPECLTAWNR